MPRAAASAPGAEQSAVDEALATSPGPAAAVVLGLDGPTRVLALGRRGGADPSQQLAIPGSTMKPLVGWIAAEAGVYRAGEHVTCAGTYPPPNEQFHCFQAHGDLDLPHAIQASCSVYFMTLGERLGLGRLADGIKRFGLTSPTGLVPGEASGWVADPSWAATRPEATKWELPVGMGHGPLEVTLLELAAAYAKLAVLLQQPNARVPDAVRLEIETGLRNVVASPDGTGHRAAVAGLEIAGKTGSAEFTRFGSGDSPQSDDNGWFVGYTPVAAPKRLVAVLVLHSGPGSETAAPLVGRIFERIGDGSARPHPGRPTLGPG